MEYEKYQISSNEIPTIEDENKIESEVNFDE